MQITPAAYARLRGLNKSTISRQIREGKIPTHDGLVDPDEADEARRNNLDMSRRRDHARSCATPSPDFAAGAGYLAQHLRGDGPIEGMSGLLLDLGIDKAQTLEAARACVVLSNLWAMEIIKAILGEKSARAFDQECADWIGTWAEEKRKKTRKARGAK